MTTVNYESDDSTVLPDEREVDAIKRDIVKAEVSEPVVINEALDMDDDVVNSEELQNIYGEWIEGTIALWKRNHGFIKYMQEGRQRSMFFHKSGVNSADQKVLLRKGMEIRFQITKGENDGDKDYGDKVESRLGEPLTFHGKYGESDSYDRTIQYDGQWFEGSVKFFSRRRGYGRIDAAEEQLEAVDAPVDDIGMVYFKEVDIDCEAYPVKIGRGDRVRFQLFNSSRGWGATHIRTEDDEPLPEFTEEDREARRAERAAEREEEEHDDDEETKPTRRRANRQRFNRRRRNDSFRQRRRTRERTDEEADVEDVQYEEIDEDARFTGTVTTFSVHRFGLIIPDDVREMKRFGEVKQGKVAFRVHEIDTESRPAMVDVDQRICFSLSPLRKNNLLYATNIRTEDEEQIVPTRVYERKNDRTLLSEEVMTGHVVFYNWRRGHGRIALDDDESETKHFFHRDDLISDDKVPGVREETRISCQLTDDSKGPAVTNVRTEDGEPLTGFLTPYMGGNTRESQEDNE